jgi:hypothetical protein
VDQNGCGGDVAGSGAGGSILLIGNNITQSGTIIVSGGASASDGTYSGGAGGYGYARLACAVLGGTSSGGVSSGSTGADCGGSPAPFPSVTPSAAATVTPY